MRRSRDFGYGVLCAAVLVAACTREAAPPVPQEPSTPRSVPDLADLSDELTALGYVDHAESDPGEGDGVVLRDAGRSWDGLNLYTSIPDRVALLIDARGQVLRTWRDTQGDHGGWARAELLPTGELLVIQSDAERSFLAKLSAAGALLWRRELEVHHDLQPLADGRIAVLTRRWRWIPEIDQTQRCIDDLIAVLSPEGELLEEHSIYDLLDSSPELYEILPRGMSAKLEVPAGSEPRQRFDPEGREHGTDLLHCNALEWVEQAGSVHVLVTSRSQNLVAMVDWDTKRLDWVWGRAHLQWPHEARFTPEGRVVLLDNGLTQRGYSRVLQFDPTTGEITWQYTAPQPSDFFTSGRGTVQPLANGNVLVSNSNSGEVFELTPEGERVWRFLNPHRSADGKRSVLRMKRYPLDHLAQ